MLSVRLQRVGRKNDPSFRMVIIDSKRGVKSADYIENVGSYNPRQKGNTTIKVDRVKYWISVGAKPTDTVHNLLINEKVIEGKKVNPLGKKTPILKEKTEEAGQETSDNIKAETAEAGSGEIETPTTDEAKPSAEAEEKTPAEEEKKDEPETPKEEPKEEAKPAEESVEETKTEDKKEA